MNSITVSLTFGIPLGIWIKSNCQTIKTCFWSFWKFFFHFHVKKSCKNCIGKIKNHLRIFEAQIGQKSQGSDLIILIRKNSYKKRCTSGPWWYIAPFFSSSEAGPWFVWEIHGSNMFYVNVYVVFWNLSYLSEVKKINFFSFKFILFNFFFFLLCNCLGCLQTIVFIYFKVYSSILSCGFMFHISFYI